MSVRAFELFGTVELKNKTSAELKKLDRDFSTTVSHAKSFGREIDGLSSKGRGLSSSFSGFKDFLSRTGSNAAGNMLSQGMSLITGGIQSAIESGKEYNRTLEQSMIGFETILGSKSAAMKHVKELEEFAFKTPFTSSELFKLSPYLQAVGFEAKNVIPVLTSVGNALAASGNSVNLERVIRQLGQMKSLGVIHFEEMNILAENGIPVWRMLAEEIAKPGENVEELQAKLMKLGGTGKLMSKDIMPILFGGLDKRYAGAMERIATTTQYGVKSSEQDARERIAGEGLRGTTDYVFTGGAYGSETERSRQRTAALQGARGDQLRTTIGSAGDKYGKAADYIQEEMLTPMAGREQFMNFIEKLTNGSLGKDIVGPMIESLRSGIGAAGEAAGDLGQSIYQGLNSIWDFGSPSRKATQLGLWINEGLEIGLTKGQSRNYANLKALTQADPNFIKTLVAGATKRGMNPDDLLNLIGIESGFNKSVVNQFGYGGLGQVGRNERASMGLPRDDAAFKRLLESNTASWQLTNVIFRLMDQKIRENPGVMKDGVLSLAEAYSMWGPGSATGNPEHIHMTKDGKRATAYRNNPQWDVNKDGVVREKELGMSAFNSLGAGKFFSVNGQMGVSDAHPMPVKFVGFTGGAEGFADIKAGAGGIRRNTRLGVGGSASVSGFNPALAYGGSATINDLSPETIAIVQARVEGMRAKEALEPITEGLNDLGVAAAITKKPLIDATEALKSHMEAFEAAQRVRAQLEAANNRGNNRAFSWEGGRSDFQGGIQSLLSGLGWQPAGGLGKQFLLNMIQSIQGRLAADFSEMISNTMFGAPKDGGGVTGGLLQRLFGSLFGGGRASGGPMSAGRIYMAGEHGRELIAGPGYVYNHRETQALMSGGGEQRTIVAIGDRVIGEAMDAYSNTGRGRRARLIQAKYGRKLQAVSY